MFDEEYWDEYLEDYNDEKYASIMDSIFDDIKNKFYEKLKDEVKNKIKNLEDENLYLSGLAETYRKELNKYKEEERNIKYEVSKARLEELFKEIGMQCILYHPEWTSSYVQKCDKCNKDRKISYKSPRGKEQFEICECGDYKKMYYPEEYQLVRFSPNRWDSKTEHPMNLWFGKYNVDSNEYNNESIIDIVANDESYDYLYEKCGEYNRGLFFKTKEECQKYCTWLSKKFGWTEDMIYDLQCNEIEY